MYSCRTRQRYKRFSLRERKIIDNLLGSHTSLRAIARRLKRPVSSVSYEVKRMRMYSATTAHTRALSARRRAALIQSKRTLKLSIYRRLRKGWSPAQIQGRMQKHNVFVPHSTTIYKHIKKRWWLKDRYIRSKKHAKPSTIHPDGPDVLKEHVLRPGLWEVDTIRFEGSPWQVVTHTETYSLFTKLYLTVAPTSKEVGTCLVETYKTHGHQIRQVVYDNEPNMRSTATVGEFYDFSTTLCQKGCPWEKPTVEYMNRVVREYLPLTMECPRKALLLQGRSVDRETLYTKEDVMRSYLQKIEDEINTRPRACLGFQTPCEVLDSMII